MNISKTDSQSWLLANLSGNLTSGNSVAVKAVFLEVRLAGPGASASIIAIVGSHMRGCGNRGEVNGRRKEHNDGEGGHYDHAANSISKLRFSTSTRNTKARDRRPVTRELVRSPILIQQFTKDTDRYTVPVSPLRIITGGEPVRTLWATSSIWIS
jgi:hypothetical protein